MRSAAAGKERIMRTGRIRFCVLALAFASMSAFAQEAPTSKKITVVGTLTRVMAIGGETSGWSLEFERKISLGGKKTRSVEITGPVEELEKLKDQRVRATGMLAHHTGMERGEYTVFEISSIRAVR
jgi:hypothetical protein